MMKPKPPVTFSEKNWRNIQDYKNAEDEYRIRLTAYWNAYYLREANSDIYLPHSDDLSQPKG